MNISNSHNEYKRITTSVLQEMKKNKNKIAVLTVYDYSFAKIFDNEKIDILLVGDSASNVIAGFDSTIPITLEHMIYHAQCVVRAVHRALVIVDMPFGSYQGNSNIALASAIRLMKETGAHGVKLEGGSAIIDTVRCITQAGIPVMGHLGLTPQSIYQFGGYSVQAREAEASKKLLEDSKCLEQAGCFAIVLEKIPALLASQVTGQLHIPTIGIGAGKECDGQVLVMHDMLGITQDFHPRFVRRYAQLKDIIASSIHQYIDDVKKQEFPNSHESY